MMRQIPLIVFLLLSGLVLVSCGDGRAKQETLQVKIVNGIAREDAFSEVVKLYIARQPGVVSVCTGTWISQNHVLTAAHCLSDAQGDKIGDDRVFLADREFSVLISQKSSQVLRNPDYDSSALEPSTAYPNIEAPVFDVGIVYFEKAYQGIPAMLSRETPKINQELTIVGFGSDGQTADTQTEALYGTITIDALDEYWLFWEFDVVGESDSCFGDSGGPGYVDFGNGLRLVSVISGGSNPECSLGDIAFNQRLDRVLDWITEATKGAVVVEESLS